MSTIAEKENTEITTSNAEAVVVLGEDGKPLSAKALKKKQEKEAKEAAKEARKQEVAARLVGFT